MEMGVKGGEGASGGDVAKEVLSPDVSKDEVAAVEEEVMEKAAEEEKGESGRKEDEQVGAAAKEDEDQEQQDVVFIQDAGFTVKVVAPGLEPFGVPVSSMELVQEIHQLLMDREDTCHRTCFSLQLNGNTLDNFAELKTVEGLKDGSVIRVVEEPYTVREARIHVRHVRDLLKSADNADAYAGLDCASLSFLNTVCQSGLVGSSGAESGNVGHGRNKNASGNSNPTGVIDCTPPDFLLPSPASSSSSVSVPLMPLHPKDPSVARVGCLKVLTLSGWNPPPKQRQMRGDLLYVFVVTLEDKRFHVTASTRGFFVNQTTEDAFNPAPAAANHHYLSHSLIDLLNQVSPGFKRNWATLLRRRAARHPFERVATPYQLHPWMAPIPDHSVDAIRAEDAAAARLGYEEHIPGQTRDWNEELQTTRELPRKTLPERLLRERAVFKVHSDFVAAAARGAVAVVDGSVMAINPGEDPKMQMFIWNNIFFSLGFDVRDHYRALGGDAAAHAAPRNDLHGVRVYNAVDLEGLHTLGTAVIDYRGFRVTAQSIIPGILEREQEQSVVYGSVDFGRTVVTHPRYVDLLQKAGNQLKILPHTVINDKDEEVMLCSSVECKGIIGNDGRHYILDLLRTFPPDVNFLEVEGLELSKEAKALGFPIVHKHKLCCLRQELIDAFVESRYVMFIKHAAVQLQQLGLRKQMDLFKPTTIAEVKAEEAVKVTAVAEVAAGEENREQSGDNKAKDDKSRMEEEEAKKIVESITDSITSGSGSSGAGGGGPSGEKREVEESTKDIVKKAARMVGSLKDTEFDIRFNPDVFSPGVRHKKDFPAELSSAVIPAAAASAGCVEDESEFFRKQCQLVKDAADFVLTSQVPAFVRDCLDHTATPMDGQTLADNLHNRGINIRYLGVVAKMLARVPQLSYVHSIAVSEVIVRSAKHIFTIYMQNLDMTCLSAGVAHFLNCFLSSQPNVSPLFSDELKSSSSSSKSKRNRRFKGKQLSGNNSSNAASTNQGGTQGAEAQEWSSLSPKSLWKQIRAEAESYYRFEANVEGVDAACAAFNLHKAGLLRSFCSKTGVALQLKEYSLGPMAAASGSNGSSSTNGNIFGEEDVVNLFPVVKHVNPRATDAYNFYTTGHTKIQQGYLKEGYELICEALNLLNNVYGAMHPEISQCLRMLARLNYIMGEHAEAMAYQQKAVFMSERVNGIDHPYTVTEYTHLALYCFANGQVSVALRLLYRARYLCLAALPCGELHPEVALIDSNVGLILHAVAEYELSLRFLEKALELNVRFHGGRSLKAAVSHHLVARTQSCMGDFRSALAHEKETFAIYQAQLGDDHDKTKESGECLRHLTQQAVLLQKKMKEINTGRTKAANLPPIQIQPPSMGSVLDMLNIINGILFVQISQQDIENFKAEFEKRQVKEQQQQPSDPSVAIKFSAEEDEPQSEAAAEGAVVAEGTD